MGSIAEKLAAAKKAAVASSGLQTGAAAGSAQALANTQKEAVPKTPSKQASVSVLKGADLIPQRKKEADVLFKCIKPTLNFVMAKIGKETRRVHFTNQYLLTDDAEIIEHLRKNMTHFGVSEVKQEIQKPTIATQPAPEKPA